MAHPWDLKVLLHVAPSRLPKALKYNMLLRDTIVAWQSIRREHKLSVMMSQWCPLMGEPYATTGGLHQAFQYWANKGLDRLHKLFQEQTWKKKTFTQLKEEFGLPQNHIFYYTQLTSFWAGLKLEPKYWFKACFIDNMIRQEKN